MLYQLTLELLLYLIHDNVDFTLFYCVRLKLDSRFNWGINSLKESTETTATTSETTPTEPEYLLGDINGDKKITVEDAQMILLYYVSNTLSGETVAWDDLLSPKSQPVPRKLPEDLWTDLDK